MSQTPIPDARGIDERLSEYRQLLAQFEAVRSRLRRAEEERETVPRRVYEKVRAEYDHQLDALRARMTPLRNELDGLRNQYEALLKEGNGVLEAIEEELAELTFRHRIGEHSDEAAVARRGEIEARLEAARAHIAEVRAAHASLDVAAAQPQRAGAETTRPHVMESRIPADAPVNLDEAPPIPDTPEEAAPEPAPVVEEAPAGVPRRPVLRATARSEPARTGFENPHDWIDEIGQDSRRPEPAQAPDAAPAAPVPAEPPAEPVPAAASALPSLVFVSGPHAGQSIPLLRTTLTIGREHDNNIEIKDVDVARYHARILNDRGEFVVEDMASATGTWVNGVRAERAALGHGDVIRIGQTEIAVDFEWASNSLERAGVDPAA